MVPAVQSSRWNRMGWEGGINLVNLLQSNKNMQAQFSQPLLARVQGIWRLHTIISITGAEGIDISGLKQSIKANQKQTISFPSIV